LRPTSFPPRPGKTAALEPLQAYYGERILESPSPLNAFGVKGLGEGDAIAPPVVIANAACDALRPFNAELNATLVCRGVMPARLPSR